MRIYKIACLFLSVFMVVSLCACAETRSPSGGELDNGSTVSTDFVPNGTSKPEEKPIEYFENPLTGVKDITEEETLLRPTAVIINNIGNAQKVQSGVGRADVVFETEVEGGITRLLALYQAPDENIAHIGSVRSARVVFAELTASMNAVLLYHGMDEVYCRPRLNELNVTRLEISQKAYGERIDNGESWEHRLYTSGSSAAAARDSIAKKNDAERNSWMNFDSERAAAEKIAKSVKVKFRGSQTTDFFYNEETGKYSRGRNGNILKDYFTGEEETFTNVFVLKTTSSLYEDGYHRNVKLSGGEGYYVTKGGYEAITWTKTGEKSAIEFKNSAGELLTVSAGNSYICIVDKNAAKVTFG